MESALHSLRDVEGVLGSFVLDAHGALRAHDMPAMFDDETLSSACQRLGQLRAALEADGDTFDGASARFGSHLLVLRAAGPDTLCVLCPLGVNLNTLQMGLNLVARRVSESSEAWPSRPTLRPRSTLPPATFAPAPLPYPPLRESTPPLRESVPPLAPERAEIVPDEPEPSRFFRGRPVR
jgi:predicted regulator of Ras-like GTPase activity (Roadblock/LC7/MglB family)